MGKLLRALPLIGRFFRKAKPSPEDVRSFWQDTLHRYGTKRLDSHTMADRTMLGQMLREMGLTRQQEFMRRWSMTVNDMVFTPYEPGIPTYEWPLWEQMKDCVHNHVRVCQERTTGSNGIFLHYVNNAAQRAMYEVDAFRNDMALEWRYNGRMMDVYATAACLRFYGCDTVDIDAAERMLAGYRENVRRGESPSDVYSWACDWLDRRWMLR
jgi:hypothetical protein